MECNFKVSVIVPIYNVEKYIAECIESIIKQDYRNLEIILVDDGSPDKSGEICDFYKNKDERIIVIHKKNAGVSAARNSGLDAATGDFVCFVDGDDYLEEDYVSYLLKQIIDNTELKIDALFKFRLLGIMKNLEVPIANFNVIRDEKINEYGKETEDENGNKSIGISVDDKEAIAKFSEDINKVIDSEVDVNIEKLKAIDVFDKGLPTEYLVKLYPIIEE